MLFSSHLLPGDGSVHPLGCLRASQVEDFPRRFFVVFVALESFLMVWTAHFDVFGGFGDALDPPVERSHFKRNVTKFKMFKQQEAAASKPSN